MIDLRVPQRQSPLAIVFLGIRILRSLGIAQIAIAALFLFRAPLNGPLIIVPFVLILIFGAFSALAWWRYTFQLIDGELVVMKGVLRADRLTVPIERIQSLSVEQELLHRITGLVKVSVDTAGSADAEFAIDAVSRPVADELQRLAVTAVPLSSASPGGAGPVPPGLADDQVVFTHPAGRLVRSALTMWPLTGLLVLGPFLAFGEQFSREIFDEVGDVEIDPSQLEWWWIPIALIGFVGFSVLLNIARVILQDWQLTLRASPVSLRRTSGLLSRTSKASSVTRIQVVSSNQNVLQQRAGLASVNLSTIGEGDLALAGCDDTQVRIVTTLAGSTPANELVLDRRIHPAQIFLAVRNALVATSLAAVMGVAAVGVWPVTGISPLYVLVFVPFVWWTERRHVDNFRWGLGSEIATRSRVFDQSNKQALLRKANSIHVSQTFFQRRRGLANVTMVTGAGYISVGMIPLDDAEMVRDTVLASAETDRRPWM